MLADLEASARVAFLESNRRLLPYLRRDVTRRRNLPQQRLLSGSAVVVVTDGIYEPYAALGHAHNWIVAKATAPARLICYSSHPMYSLHK